MTSMLKKGLTLLRAPVNSVSFAARQALRWRRGCPLLVNEDKTDLFDYLQDDERASAEAREQDLRERYDLRQLRSRSTRLDYRDNLALLDNLEAVFAELPPTPGVDRVRVLDIGVKNWNYVFALERFFRGCYLPRRQVQLLGLEIDGHGIYRDMRSRADHAGAFVGQTQNPDVQYRVADFLKTAVDGQFDVVTLLYPFMTRHALLAWGLPLRHFQPQRLVARALAALRPGGLLAIFNQTRQERDALHQILQEQGVGPSVIKPLRSRLVGYWHQTQDRWGTVVYRSAPA